MVNILLLGGFGFIGSNIMKYIDLNFKNQYRVIVFDKFSTHPYSQKFECLYSSYDGDFSDSSILEKIFIENQIDLVIHSLSTTIPISSNNAIFDIQSNLIPTLNLLDLMVKYNSRKIIYISSGGAIYGNNNLCHKETEDVFPISSYGAIKLTIEKYLFLYSAQYEIKPLILRLSNPYGPFHYSMKQGIINVAMSKAIRKDKIEIYGNGNNKKDYIYINDCVDILFRLYNMNLWNEIYNIGSGELLSINQIISEIKKIKPDVDYSYIEKKKLDVQSFSLDLTKLLCKLSSYKFTPFKKGIIETYNWEKSKL